MKQINYKDSYEYNANSELKNYMQNSPVIESDIVSMMINKFYENHKETYEKDREEFYKKYNSKNKKLEDISNE